MIGSTAKVLLAVLLAASNAILSSAVHYEKPPCGSDEKAVQLMGIDGVFCSPQCSPDCPTDVPDGVTAVRSLEFAALVVYPNAIDCNF
jgi:hypothetical protein